MPTILTKLPVENVDSVGLAPIVISSEELRIFANPNLKRMFRASDGFSPDTGWLCRLTGKPLVRSRASWPTLQTIAAYNNKPSLLFPATPLGGYTLWDNGENMLPAGSFTVVVVGRSGDADNAHLWGNRGAANGSISYGTHNNAGGLGAAVYDLGGVQRTTNLSHNSNAYVRPWSAGPNCHLTGYDSTSGLTTFRANYGAFQNSLAAGTLGSGLANREFHVGEAMTGTNTQASPLEGGDIAEILIFDTDLTRPANAGLLQLVETYVQARYQLTV
jgi:hypothetical protein